LVFPHRGALRQTERPLGGNSQIGGQVLSKSEKIESAPKKSFLLKLGFFIPLGPNASEGVELFGGITLPRTLLAKGLRLRKFFRPAQAGKEKNNR
jgi:hypothetical protein